MKESKGMINCFPNNCGIFPIIPVHNKDIVVYKPAGSIVKDRIEKRDFYSDMIDYLNSSMTKE